MNNLTLRQLRYVDALARHRHFGRAADACAVTQPALSMQIRDLEAGLGAPLFDRSGRALRLTGFGEAFVARARDILRAVDDLADLARAAQDGPVGRLRLGIIPTVAPYLLPEVTARLSRLYPGLDLHLRETVTPVLLDELGAGRLDAAIVALPVSEPGVTEAPLFSERFVLLRPAADAGKPVPGRESLREMRLLLLEEGHCFRDQALAFCDMRSGRPREVFDGHSLSTLVQMVAAGLGVTLLPEMALPVETRSAAVSVARFPAPEPERTIGLVWRQSSPLAAQFRRIAAALSGAPAGAAIAL
jgi:LysR family hydrogen peroxide-inducible transcriptional activator